MNPHPCLSHCFYGRTKLTQKSMLVSTYWPYYSEMEYKENYRRVMVVCVRNSIHLGQRPPRCWGHRLQITQPIAKSGTGCIVKHMCRCIYSSKQYCQDAYKINILERKILLFRIEDRHWNGKCSPIFRRVWRYQRGNQNPSMEEEQTTQWPKEKGQMDKQWYLWINMSENQFNWFGVYSHL